MPEPEDPITSLDLHAWITRQVDLGERAESPHTRDCCSVPQVFSCCGSEDRCECFDTFPCDCPLPAAAQRRIEADRRILARHKVDPSRVEDFTHATACEGCGEWGEFSYPVSENINDCPELLDLAHAYGITPEILAALHRPQPPEVKPTPPSPFGRLLAEAYGPALLNGLHTSLVYGRARIPPVELPREHPEET